MVSTPSVITMNSGSLGFTGHQPAGSVILDILFLLIVEYYRVNLFQNFVAVLFGVGSIEPSLALDHGPFGRRRDAQDDSKSASVIPAVVPECEANSNESV